MVLQLFLIDRICCCGNFSRRGKYFRGESFKLL